MNFDVTKVIAEMDPQEMKTPAPKPVREPVQEKKLSPVEELMQKNAAYDGARVDHRDQNGVHILKNESDRDMEDIMKELPGTMAEMQGLGNRITRAKLKLGLGEGGFVDQEIEVFNHKTGRVDGVRWATSAEINAEFIAREPAMSDEELEDFLKSYFVEFDLKTGEVKPRKYPGKPGLKCSVIFPTNAVNDVTPVNRVDGENKEYQKQEAVQNDTPKIVEENTTDDTTPVIEKTKIKFRIEERDVGVRKKIQRDKVASISEMILDRNAVPMTAVASRYKCDITAVTYEEYDQLHTMVETSTLARELKMWSMVYRHVKNATIGEFKSFENFCEKTAWADRQRFWFALMCSMTVDKDTTMITCHNDVFKRADGYEKLDLSDYKEAYKDINVISLLPTTTSELPDRNIYVILDLNGIKYKYIPVVKEDAPESVKWEVVETQGDCNTTYPLEFYNRSLIDTDNLPKWVESELNHINEISSLEEALSYHTEGALHQKRIVDLNDVVSVEVGFKSVADVLRKDYKYIVPEEVAKTVREICKEEIVRRNSNPDYEPSDDEISEFLQADESGTILTGVVICQIADRVIVKDQNGEEFESDDPSIIADIIKKCSPADVSILFNEYDNNHLLYRYASSYEPTFSYKNCKCPSCGYTVNVPIPKIEDLVFTLSRSLTNTTFDITTL